MASKILIVIGLVLFALAAFGVTFEHFLLVPAGLACVTAAKLC